MGEAKNITLTSDNGEVENVEVILPFKFNDTNKKYLIYTKNETDASGNVTLYAGAIEDTPNGEVLNGIDTDEEWTKIKDVLKALSKDSD